MLLVYYVFWGWNNIHCFNNYQWLALRIRERIEEVWELGKKGTQSYADPLQATGSVKMRCEAAG